MMTVPDYLEQSFKNIAKQQQQSVDVLLARLIEEYLEDYYDIQLAEQALKRIEDGQDELLNWEDVKTGLYDVED